MSNPISSLPNRNDAAIDAASDADTTETSDTSDAVRAELEAVRGESSPELEVDPIGDETPTLETDENGSVADDTPAAAPEKKSRGGSGLLLLVLAGLLLGSVAINLKQSRDNSTLEARSQEYQQALAAAVERIDDETARADSAESALDRVDSAVDVVNERVVGLQEALDALRTATVRD